MAKHHLQTTALYSRYQSLSSRDARANLPVIIDEVVDSGKPVLIEKLGVPRAAIIPARNLPAMQALRDVARELGMPPDQPGRSADELMLEMFARLHIRFNMPSA